jgi:hypothetical protein
MRSALKPLQDAGIESLCWEWVQFWQPLYKLCQGNDTFATLQWGRAARGRTFDGGWTFTPVGRGRIEICRSDSSVPSATYEAAKRGKGSLIFNNGCRYCWQAETWTTAAAWRLTDGGIVLRMQAGSVRMGSAETSCQDLSVMVLLGQYFAIKQDWDRMRKILRLVGGFIGPGWV